MTQIFLLLLLLLSGCKTQGELRDECSAKGGVYVKVFNGYECVELKRL